MYSNDNHFTKDPFEDNGRCLIHPLSTEGLEAYLSKDSYNYHYLNTKADPELMKQIKKEYEEELAKKESLLQQEKKETQNQKEDPKCCENLKADNKDVKNINCKKNCKKSPGKKTNDTKCCKGKTTCAKKEDVKAGSNNCTKKNVNQGKKKITGKNLAQRIQGQGATMPIISNVNADYHSLKNYPQPKQF